MIAIPSLELRDRHCVQPAGGDPAPDCEYADDPVTVARRWAAAGFACLHVVDHDAASGHGDNRDLVRDLLRQVAMPMQVAAGVHEEEVIASFLEDGADQVIVGKRGIEDPSWLMEQATLVPGRLILAVDLRDGLVAARGWAARSSLRLDDVLAALASAPLAGLLLTAVRRDGKSEETDLPCIEEAALASPWPLIVAGSAGELQELRNLEDRGVSAVVLGTSLFSAALDVRVVAEEFAA